MLAAGAALECQGELKLEILTMLPGWVLYSCTAFHGKGEAPSKERPEE